MGAGVRVAVIDSGVNVHADHPSNMYQYNFLGGEFNAPFTSNGIIKMYNDQPLTDSFGHGTHVAGIISGNGSQSKRGGERRYCTRLHVAFTTSFKWVWKGDIIVLPIVQTNLPKS